MVFSLTFIVVLDISFSLRTLNDILACLGAGSSIKSLCDTFATCQESSKGENILSLLNQYVRVH